MKSEVKKKKFFFKGSIQFLSRLKGNIKQPRLLDLKAIYKVRNGLRGKGKKNKIQDTQRKTYLSVKFRLRVGP